MTDRSVGIDLVARVQGFVAGINTARAATKGFITDLEKSAKKQQALRELGNAAGVMGAVAAAGFFMVVKSAADFDQAMSNVQAATHETAGNMDLLRQAALDAGQSTVFSATESAAAIEELSKAGVSTADILGGGLTGALDLAAAGGIEVAEAAETAASAMTQFGLSGGEVPHIADLLAAGAGKAQGSVSDMGAALNQVGLVANQTGLSIEETTGGLAAFASAGLTGSDAGTSFKTMLQSLTPRSAEAAALMEKLNISAYDSQGNFIGLTNYAGKLKDALSGMSEQQQAATLKTIFGSDAVRAASVLYKQGAEGIQGWIDKTDDAGYAAETAATRMDNLKGDLEQLRGALETAFIGTGDASQGPLRELLQMITGMINAYNELPGPVKTGTLAIMGLTAVVGLSAFAASRAVLAYGNFQTNLKTLGINAEVSGKKMMAARAGALALGIGLLALGSNIDESHQELKALATMAGSIATGLAVAPGPVGAALGVAGGAMALFAQSSQQAAAAQQALDAAGQSVAATLDAETGALTSATTAAAQKAIADKDGYDTAAKLGLSLDTVTQAALGNKDAMAEVASAIDAVPDEEIFDSGGPTEFGEKLIGLHGIVDTTSGKIGDAKESIAQQGDAAAASGEKTALLGDKMADAASDAQKLTDKMLALNNAMLDDRASMRDFEAAIDAARKALKDNGRTLDDGTEKGRANADALDAMARAANAHTASMEKNKASVGAQRAFMVSARKELESSARAFGMSRGQAERYADSVLRIPKKAKTAVTTETAAALNAIDNVWRQMNLIDGTRVTTFVDTVNRVFGKINPFGNADGGHIRGPGTGRSDSIPAWLSDGEFVVNAKATSRNLGLLHSINAQGFAAGGRAGQTPLERWESSDKFKDLTRALSKMERALGKATDKYDRATDKLDAIESASRSYAESVKSAFTHDALGGSLAESQLQLRADRNDARRASADLKRLRHRGLGGGLLKQLQASGNTSLIDELAHMSKKELHEYEGLFSSTNKATSRLGNTSANAVFGRQISQQTHATRRLHHSIDKLNNRIDRLEGAVERGSHKGTRDGNRDRDHRAAVRRKSR